MPDSIRDTLLGTSILPPFWLWKLSCLLPCLDPTDVRGTPGCGQGSHIPLENVTDSSALSCEPGLKPGKPLTQPLLSSPFPSAKTQHALQHCGSWYGKQGREKVLVGDLVPDSWLLPGSLYDSCVRVSSFNNQLSQLLWKMDYLPGLELKSKDSSPGSLVKGKQVEDRLLSSHFRLVLSRYETFRRALGHLSSRARKSSRGQIELHWNWLSAEFSFTDTPR